jgi:hypothetical protein
VQANIALKIYHINTDSSGQQSIDEGNGEKKTSNAAGDQKSNRTIQAKETANPRSNTKITNQIIIVPWTEQSSTVGPLN